MFTKQFLDEFRIEVKQTLKALAEKHGLTVKPDRIKYCESNFSMDVKFTKDIVDGKPFEQAEFEKFAILYGFAPVDYHKTFVMGGKTYTIYGFLNKARKNPVLAKGPSGNYRFSTEIKGLLK